VIQALSLKRHGLDLNEATEKVFGAPPLLNEQIEMGKIDAVINNWNFVAELEAKGFRKLIGADEAARDLGITSDVPLLGYVFDETWATAHRDDALGLIRASRKAKQLLAQSDPEWERLRPMMKASDEAAFKALRDEFRSGIPQHWGEAERSDAARLFVIMAKLGGTDLVGKSQELQPGTFWPEVSY
jgi:NitT/TauT family transport system substrate-binding protein